MTTDTELMTVRRRAAMSVAATTLLLAVSPAAADTSPVKIGTLAYIDFSAGQRGLSAGDTSSYNVVRITRGYLNIKKKLLPFLAARITPDAHLEDNGDYAVRLKYLYGELMAPDLGPLTHTVAEIGLGHMPWLDFEEHINLYRCQGTMAIERAGVFNSADLGASVRGYIGDALADAETRTGNHHYAGRWGSWHVGVYNGGGYHAPEKNENKTIQGRLTLRPLPDLLPGLQLSYFGLHGKGNARPEDGRLPAYRAHLGMLSYEHALVAVTAQAFVTQGDAKGSWIGPAGGARKTLGTSVFANLRLPVGTRKVGVLARYDRFDADRKDKVSDEATYDMVMGGMFVDLHGGNMVLLAYEGTFYGEDSGGKKKNPEVGEALADDHRGQLVYQIKF